MNAAGTAPAGGDADQPQMSADGRFVAFVGGASNIVSPPMFSPHVLLRDMQTHATRVVSQTAAGVYGNAGVGSFRMAPSGQAIVSGMSSRVVTSSSMRSAPPSRPE